MKRLLRLMAPGLLAFLADASIAAETDLPSAPRPPFELTRSLQALQDQVAIGSEAANDAQRMLLIHIGEQFLAADPEVWREPANARAAVVYVLGGGQPEIMRRLLALEEPPAIDRSILTGALAYATGRQDAAWIALQDVDARSLAPSLGAHLALIQASLTMAKDPEAAVGYLESARLMAPGTLVEEAALRRQLSVASALSDSESFEFLARQYIRRFRHSVYARNFLRDFVDLWTDLEMPGGAEAFARLEATIAGLDATDQRDLYLSVAQRKLSAGETATASAAAARAFQLSDNASAAALRAALYQAAAQVVGQDRAQGLKTLEGIDPSRLSESDARLREAALSVANQVGHEPQTAALPAAVEADGQHETPVIKRAQEAVSAADDLLRRTR